MDAPVKPAVATWFGGRNPTPLDSAASFWRLIAQAATVLMAALAIGVVLYFSRAILLPVLCAIVVGMTFGPLVGRTERAGLPSWLAATLVVVLLVALANLAIVTLATPLSELIGRAPEIGGAIKDKLRVLDRPLAALYELQVALGVASSPSEPAVTVAPTQILQGVLTILTPAAVQFVIQVVLFLGTLFFFIMGRSQFRRHFVTWFGTRDARLRALKILNDIEENLSSYLLVVTAINFGLGVVTFIMAYLLGLPAPLLWGALAWGLNYVPYVGPAIMYVLLFIIGLLTFPTLWGALLPPGIFMAVTLVEGQVLTPAIVGRQVLNISPFAVFLGIAFWAWMWGPLGAFLATPILIVGCVIVDHLYPRQAGDLLPE